MKQKKNLKKINYALLKSDEMKFLAGGKKKSADKIIVHKTNECPQGDSITEKISDTTSITVVESYPCEVVRDTIRPQYVTP
jgi:hypothetical protein